MNYLDVRFEGFDKRVGCLRRENAGAVSFIYDELYLKLEDAMPLSLSLPLQEQPFSDYVSKAYFHNLLPENDQYDLVRQREGLESDDVYGLLYHLGADCSGAVSCLPAGSPPMKVPGVLSTDYDFLEPALVEDIVKRLANRQSLPDGLADPSPVAGVQKKIALVATPDGQYALPKEGRRVPTTHILKVPHRNYPLEARYEVAAAQLAQACGLDVAVPEYREFGEYPAIIVSRYDRIFTMEGHISRIHQEDFAQALGLQNRLKYERNGGEKLKFDADAIVSILLQCRQPAESIVSFLRATFFNLIIGNNDNHAKNHSLLYSRGATPTLAPLYDMVPVKLNDQYTHELAFNIGNASFSEDLTVEDIFGFLAQFGVVDEDAMAFINGPILDLIQVSEAMSGLVFQGLKKFDDLFGTEAERIIELLDLPIELKERDYFEPKPRGWTMS